MTVSSQTNKIIYIGNGVAKEFAIPFSFLEQQHIKVEQKLKNVQAERTDWSVKDGNLVFENAPESGAEIAIVREVPLTQETDYRDNEILHAETLERNFDKLTMQVQQLAEKQDRAVTVDIFDDTAADSLIPSIRRSVSDAAAYAAIAQSESQTAARQAQNAEASATNAGISETHTAEMLETKANINADNFSQTGKEAIVRSVFPSSQSENLSVVSGQTITPIADGYISVAGISQTAARALIVITNTVTGLSSGDHAYSAGTVISAFLPVAQGENVTITFDNITVSSAKFIPAQGEVL